jgi:hypothetical protein
LTIVGSMLPLGTCDAWTISARRTIASRKAMTTVEMASRTLNFWWRGNCRSTAFVDRRDKRLVRLRYSLLSTCSSSVSNSASASLFWSLAWRARR